MKNFDTKRYTQRIILNIGNLDISLVEKLFLIVQNVLTKIGSYL